MTSKEELAKELKVSVEAVELTRSSDVIDLHVDSFIPQRLFGWNVLKRHRPELGGGVFFGHLDLPRGNDVGLKGAMWSITTNPFRSRESRWNIFQENLRRLQSTFDDSNGKIQMVRSTEEYFKAKKDGAHACFLSIQGGNALEAAPGGVASLPPGLLTRVTLVHLTNSAFGSTSSPLACFRRDHHLTDQGKAFVRDLNRHRIFVDLAHIHPVSFWDVINVHDHSQPLIVTHTGVSGVHPHWRNLDDDQIQAIAKTGGVIGIIAHAGFLRPQDGKNDASLIVDHVEHVLRITGTDDHIGIGTDFDGFIIPPHGFRSASHYPRLTQEMLDRGWKSDRIQKVLGSNFLASFQHLRSIP
jgi:membrane dipeptidase